MTETELDLARRLAGHPKWKWMDGMQFVCPSREEPTDRVFDAGAGETGWGTKIRRSHVPDIADPATQGCLWAMLGKSIEIGVEYPGKWRVRAWGDDEIIEFGATLGEALARALLAAWGET